MRLEYLWDETTNEIVRDAVGPAAPAFELLTHLGDGAVLLVAGILIYWFGARGNRRKRAFVIAVGTAALALSAGMKGIMEIPRPELAFSPDGYPGFTFPSAHAMGAAAFYGALAVSMERGTKGIRYLMAGAIITVVAVSRVVMGVHYAGDVVVGVGLGLALVGVGLWVREEELFDPGPLFLIATAIAVVAALLGSRVFVTLTLGASIGGTIGWYYVRNRRTTTVGASILVLGLVGIGGIIALRGLSALIGYGVSGGTNTTGVLVLEVIAYATLTATVMAVPHFGLRIEQRPSVRWLQETLPFRGRIIGPEKSFTRDD
ncbi:phosphatase PAP2 family protein [Natrarchaeobius halalkaliphilus]|uniref:Phosphatase PAP2 family protein n=1 Tax=Natrarchaeobius halalkaliphilus TaxID=1679091 RepID=A0A3N6M1X6_9EURY|nr:phosphatase PAP2 family protein [Natrarchaeobius halalkaliphilus]RQG89790.1 phosphatase PAP2 family protein [Natrarchaeobius halalkaliphilus]